jgi:hypothetical protein
MNSFAFVMPCNTSYLITLYLNGRYSNNTSLT